jgi:hypothetical protein
VKWIAEDYSTRRNESVGLRTTKIEVKRKRYELNKNLDQFYIINQVLGLNCEDYGPKYN